MTMDFDYWVRMARHFTFKNLDRELSCATYHEEAKTGDGFAQYHGELRRRATHYWPPPTTLAHWRLRASMFKHLTYRPWTARLSNSLSYRLGRVRKLFAGGGGR
jgi:hypothetical protein